MRNGDKSTMPGCGAQGPVIYKPVTMRLQFLCDSILTTSTAIDFVLAEYHVERLKLLSLQFSTGPLSKHVILLILPSLSSNHHCVTRNRSNRSFLGEDEPLTKQ